jgi:hypothetical protein
MRGAIPPLPNTPSWHGAQLKHRGNFTFTLQTYTSRLILALRVSVLKPLTDTHT